MPSKPAVLIAKPIVFSFEELQDPNTDLTERIMEAFGPDSLGVACVRGVPQYEEFRAALLPKVHTLGSLPTEVLEEYVVPDAYYAVGWSHGKEKLGGGKPDTGKGSFYANPLFEDPGALDPTAVERHPACATPNVWPKEVSGFREAFVDGGQLLARVAKMIVGRMDKACEEHNVKCVNLVDATFNNSRLCCGRALHYFPLPEEAAKEDGNLDSWCGWHNDNSTITGLFSSMLLDAETGLPSTKPIDPEAGLYAQSRNGQVMKIEIPVDCVGFQLGEAAQILTGGHMVATPHMVRGSTIAGVSREQMAVFFEPSWDKVMTVPDGVSTEEMVNAGTNIPEVPPLAKRYRGPSVTFGEYLADSFREYYSMAMCDEDEGKAAANAA